METFTLKYWVVKKNQTSTDEQNRSIELFDLNLTSEYHFHTYEKWPWTNTIIKNYPQVVPFNWILKQAISASKYTWMFFNDYVLRVNFLISI